MKAILTKYHGPTNTRGSRISATDSDGNRVSIPYDSSLNSEDAHRKAAQRLCDKMGWKVRLECGGLKNGYAWIMLNEDTRDATTKAIDSLTNANEFNS